MEDGTTQMHDESEPVLLEVEDGVLLNGTAPRVLTEKCNIKSYENIYTWRLKRELDTGERLCFYSTTGVFFT